MDFLSSYVPSIFSSGEAVAEVKTETEVSTENVVQTPVAEVKPEVPVVPEVKPETPVVEIKPEVPAVPETPVAEVKPEVHAVEIKPEVPAVPETPVPEVKPEVPAVERQIIVTYSNKSKVSIKQRYEVIKGTRIKDGIHEDYFYKGITVCGPIKSKCTFVNGKKEGIEYIYDEAGNIIKENTFQNGVYIPTWGESISSYIFGK